MRVSHPRLCCCCASAVVLVIVVRSCTCAARKQLRYSVRELGAALAERSALVAAPALA
jgi:hypothetical protein